MPSIGATSDQSYNMMVFYGLRLSICRPVHPSCFLVTTEGTVNTKKPNGQL